MSTTKIIKGWVSPGQARRSSDGYDGGIVRLNVYGPDEPNEGCDIYDYDEPATLYIGTGKLWTEDEVLKLLHAIDSAIMQDRAQMAIRHTAAKHGLTL